MSADPSDELRELARSYGVQVEYRDMSGRTRPASGRSLLAVLRVLGVEIADEADAPRAFRERQSRIWRIRLDPVIVAWDGEPARADVRFPRSLGGSNFRCRLTSEAGDVREWAVAVGSLVRVIEPAEIPDGEKYASASLFLPPRIPLGYHRLQVAFDDGVSAEATVFAAPRRAFDGPSGAGKRPWGVFSPLHALHGPGSWGAGDLGDLEALIDWTAGLGGGLVATLPMLASNFDGPSPLISPYSPTSRLFWNEFYLDLDRIPELADCEAARTLIESEFARGEIEALRASGLVDYGRQMRLKRAVLELLADHLVALDNERNRAFTAYIAANPLVASYAFFQAAGERHGRNWRDWPSKLQKFHEGADIDPRAFRYHLFAQWQAEEQLRALSTKSVEKGMTWYLDFPVGVDFNSFDVWSNPDAFATGASVGCPPDPVFTKGQNWGFPPLHPEKQREQGYAYLIASFRNHLRFANALRIDHVMGLHRLFWIPAGAEAKDGAFVSTPAEEIYAILSIESHKHSAWLVGEGPGDRPARGRRRDEAAQRPRDVRRPVRSPARPRETAPGVPRSDRRQHQHPRHAPVCRLLGGRRPRRPQGPRPPRRGKARSRADRPRRPASGRRPAPPRPGDVDRGRPGHRRRHRGPLGLARRLARPRPPAQRRGPLARDRAAEHPQHLRRAAQLATETPPAVRPILREPEVPRSPQEGRRTPIEAREVVNINM